VWYETCVQDYQKYLISVIWDMWTGLSEVIKSVKWEMGTGLSEIIIYCDMRYVYNVIRSKYLVWYETCVQNYQK
jgi:hypothetical protein